MNELLKEMRARPGDWVFLVPFSYGMIAMEWEWVLFAFAIGWLINLCFGKPTWR